MIGLQFTPSRLTSYQESPIPHVRRRFWNSALSPHLEMCGGVPAASAQHGNGSIQLRLGRAVSVLPTHTAPPSEDFVTVKKQPAFHLYTGDLLKDKNFLACGGEAQALWSLMLIHLHDMPLRGEFRLAPDMPPMDYQTIANLIAYPIAKFEELISQILHNRVASVIDGAIANRRMVRERQLSEIRSEAGQKGNILRWHKDNNGVANESQNIAPSCLVTPSSPNSKKNSPKKVAITDVEWIAELKGKSLYVGINIEQEFQKCQAWCEVRGLETTRTRFINWLNKALKDKPMGQSPKPTRPTKVVL